MFLLFPQTPTLGQEWRSSVTSKESQRKHPSPRMNHLPTLSRPSIQCHRLSAPVCARAWDSEAGVHCQTQCHPNSRISLIRSCRSLLGVVGTPNSTTPAPRTTYGAWLCWSPPRIPEKLRASATYTHDCAPAQRRMRAVPGCWLLLCSLRPPPPSVCVCVGVSKFSTMPRALYNAARQIHVKNISSVLHK